MDSTQLVQIRRDFYGNIRRRVELILGQESRAIRTYRDSYEKEIMRLSWQSVDKKHLFARLKQADVVLIGDFHAQKQSSRAFLRIIRKIENRQVLALECLRKTDQPVIDSFLAGELTEKEFLSQVAWKKNWNFPWENYKPLFKWAQQNKVRIYGINSQSANHTLQQRDTFSAELINEIHKLNKGAQIVVQYGDLHLCSNHLPKQIKKKNAKLNTCVVFQSPEVLYFKIMEHQKELTTDVVKLTQDMWALNSLPPWIKWQDYLLLLESGHDKRVRNIDIEPTDTVAETVQFVSKSFGFNISLAGLSVYSSTDDQFFNQLDRLSILLKRKIIENVQEGISFYVPELECGYLARYSVNHVTRIAAQYVYSQLGGYKKTIIDPKKEFYKLIWLEAVVYLFSKIKNPKRKTDTLQDIRSSLQKEQFDDRGKEALMLSLTQKLSEMQFLSMGKLRTMTAGDMNKYGKKSFSTAAQILGGIMGEKFFYALNKKLIRLPENQGLIFKNLNSQQFQKIYFESLEMIESWPVSFKSKYDKL